MIEQLRSFLQLRTKKVFYQYPKMQKSRRLNYGIKKTYQLIGNYSYCNKLFSVIVESLQSCCKITTKASKGLNSIKGNERMFII